MSKKHAHKKSYYNDIALRLAHKILGVQHLHYGFFKGSLKPTMQNLPAAQNAYVKNLISYIPAGVRTIFDVGCGTGGVASQLVKKYNLTCLAPDPYLTQKTAENTGHRAKTITDLYENVTDLPPESFDMVLMSESVQYIKMDEGWALNERYVKKGGYVLASDFFQVRKIDEPGYSKSGHPLDEYIRIAGEHGFTLKKKSDITPFTAPTMDIYQEIILDRVFPIVEAIFEFVNRRYPLLYRFLRLFLGKRVHQLKEKYSRQDAAHFTKFKGYFVLLFQKRK